MTRTKAVVIQNNFTKGLVTDTTGLAFPEDACTDTNNCIFSVFGNVSRRSPFDFENSYSTFTKTVTSNAIVTYVWNNVAGEGDITFVVVQIGNDLYFYRANSDQSLSAGKHATSIALSTFYPAGITSVATLECQFSSGNGLLFVTNSSLNSFYVTYNPDTDAFSATTITVQIRDFAGDVADPETDTSRPTSTLAGLNAAHRYNLENQGWTTATLTSWDTARADMPSNADVNWYFKSATNAFDFTTVADRAIGNSLAPKGHFIYSIYNFNRSANVSGATDYSIATARLSTSTFFSGRVFYSGLNVAKENSKIFFTQIIEASAQYGKCYQTNDPSSEELFDLLPADGGVIDLLEAGNILKMIPMFNNIIVFCSNGIWTISGSQGVNFSATDYSIHRLSKLPLFSNTSFVEAEGVPYWWTNEGIFTITSDPQTNNLKVQCISDGAIRGFILSEILSNSKLYVRGTYDPFTKTIQWLYRSTDPVAFNDRYIFDRLLTYNLLNKSWYPWSVSNTNVHISSIINIYGLSGSFVQNNIVNGANNVVNSGNQVINFSVGTEGINNINKFFVSYTSGGLDLVTWAEHREDLLTYKDWASFDAVGEEYESFFTTGYAVHGQAVRKFQTNYINVYSEILANVSDIVDIPDSDFQESSYKIQSCWDFAVTANSGKWSSSQLINVSALGFAFKTNRIKLRGHGKAFQFKITNNGTNNFNLIGWSIVETGNQWI